MTPTGGPNNTIKAKSLGARFDFEVKAWYAPNTTVAALLHTFEFVVLVGLKAMITLILSTTGARSVLTNSIKLGGTKTDTKAMTPTTNVIFTVC